MTTTRKIAANRTNAKASTGPRTARGKSKSAQNARRHGLSLPLSADPLRAAQARNLAHEIAGKSANAEIPQAIRRFAEAQIELVRVRQTRQEVFGKQSLFEGIEELKTNPKKAKELIEKLSDAI